MEISGGKGREKQHGNCAYVRVDVDDVFQHLPCVDP